MPELPEVEVNRENLERWLSGKKIRRAVVRDRKVAGGKPVRKLVAALAGARVVSVSRRAKHLVLDLGSRGKVLAHLGMTGKFLLRRKTDVDPPGTRVVLELAVGERVVFQDVRRFGHFKLLDRQGEALLETLGVEPLSKEFSPRLLEALLRETRLPVKLFLMDQRRVAGLGNIYAAEALFLAGIHPSRPAQRLSREQARRLHAAIRRTLKESLAEARAPEITYVEEPEAENPFRVYGREGEPCPRCRQPIRRLPQGGRSTFFCASCQRR